MLAVLAILSSAIMPPPVILPDTPPPLPIPAERLAELKSESDIVATTRLADGSRAPADLVLPQLTNRGMVLNFMLENYPLELRDRYDFEMPWAWVYISERGQPQQVRIVKTSGRAAFDSLAVRALRVAVFAPALIRGKPVGAWVPIPIEIAYKDLAQRAPKERQQPGEPSFTPYTVKPGLLNRNDVSKALVRNYPPKLRAAGVGGTTLVWVYIDEAGRTAKALVKNSSGEPELDSAALAVARIMQFSPASNRGETVAVWIQLPIVFLPAPIRKR